MLRFSLGLAVVFAAWWLLSAAAPAGVVPPPEAVLPRLAGLLIGGGLAVHAAASLLRVAAGLILALGLGVPAGLALGRFKALDAVFAPAVYLLYPVPKIALLPVIILLAGVGEAPKIALLALVLFFQVLIPARDAARGLERSYLVSLRSLGGTDRHLFRFVLLPSLLPGLVSSLRVGTGTALAVLFFAETFFTRYGLGVFIVDNWMKAAYVDMFAGIAALGLAGLAVFKLIDLAERLACPWLARTSFGE